jgi:hypothetical protein
VHFYLLRRDTPWESIPILAAQLLGSRRPPFPHFVLERQTSDLVDEECVLCLWNIAVSRPKVLGRCRGGNWTRGTNSDSIMEVWHAFRASCPDTGRARGFWNDPILVPTLVGSQIAANIPLLRLAASGTPELLLQSPVQLAGGFKAWAFSKEDQDALSSVLPEQLNLEFAPLPLYAAGSPVTAAWRERIEGYLAGRAPFPSDLDFDGRR